MKQILIILLLFFSMCSGKKETQDRFSGNFKGGQTGIVASMSLTASGDEITGTITMNGGDPGKITGTITADRIKGQVQDRETGKAYDFTGSINGDELQFSIIFPELDNKEINLVMKKETVGTAGSSGSDAATIGTKERNDALVGVWKNTEVLGGGNDGMSFSTKYFMEFRDDGTALSWTGRSAGAGTSFDSDEAGAEKGQWYTEGKTLYLVDMVTKKEASTYYSVEQNRLMLYNEGTAKKIFERVR